MPLRILAAVSATSLIALAGAWPAEAAPAGPTYVALGDSYAAGYGLPAPALPTGAPNCGQTSLDYPHRLATSLELALTDVTCSGAVTGDLSTPQQGTTAPAQLDALKTGPDLVTITIGGNDLGFSSIARTCLATSPSGPLYGAGSRYPSCHDYFASPEGMPYDPYARLTDVQTKVGAAIAATKKAAPEAKIVVVGYPAIAPDAAHTPLTGCFAANRLTTPVAAGGITLASAFPFTDQDVPYLQELQQRLDTAIQNEARAADVTYSSVYTDSLAQSACAPQAQRWTEPVIPGGGGSNALHPSLAGTSAMAEAVTPVVRTLLSLAPPPVNTPPVNTPPVATPPVKTAPVKASPVRTHPVKKPAAKTPTKRTTQPSRSTAVQKPLHVSTSTRAPVRRLAKTGPAPALPLTGVALALLIGGTGMVAGARRRG